MSLLRRKLFPWRNSCTRKSSERINGKGCKIGGGDVDGCQFPGSLSPWSSLERCSYWVRLARKLIAHGKGNVSSCNAYVVRCACEKKILCQQLKNIGIHGRYLIQDAHKVIVYMNLILEIFRKTVESNIGCGI